MERLASSYSLGLGRFSKINGFDVESQSVYCGQMQINPDIFSFCNFTPTDNGLGERGYYELRTDPGYYINLSEVAESLAKSQGVNLTPFEEYTLIKEIGGGEKNLPDGKIGTNGSPLNISQVDGKIIFDWVPGKEMHVNPQDFAETMMKFAYPNDYVPELIVPTAIPTPVSQPSAFSEPVPVAYNTPVIKGVTDRVQEPKEATNSQNVRLPSFADGLRFLADYGTFPAALLSVFLIGTLIRKGLIRGNRTGDKPVDRSRSKGTPAKSSHENSGYKVTRRGRHGPVQPLEKLPPPKTISEYKPDPRDRFNNIMAVGKK